MPEKSEPVLADQAAFVITQMNKMKIIYLRKDKKLQTRELERSLRTSDIAV